MSRQEIELDEPVERLSILDEEGAVDDSLEPDLDDDTLLALLRTMVLSRRFDERLLQLQRQGRIGTFAPVKGQEAAQLGAVAAVEEKDWVVPSFRETAAALWRGTPLSDILLYNAGYNEGAAVAEERRDFPILVPVASQLPLAAGLAYGARLQGNDDVVLTFFGDGATSEGDFHESLNFAAVFRAPVIFVCENNQWAISLPREKQTRSSTLAQKGLAYAIPGMQVDGNDVLSVYAATREAVERARAGDGPTLIECVTYRLSVHTTADDPSKYRSDEEVEEWEDRDPLPRFQSYLRERGLVGEEDLASIEDESGEEIDSAWREAEERMKQLEDPLVMFDHVWAEGSRTLDEQREELRRHLSEGEEN